MKGIGPFPGELFPKLQYQLGFILIFALVFNIHGMQVFYFIVVLNDDIGNTVCMSHGRHLQRSF